MNYVELTDALIGCNFAGDEQRLETVLEFLKQQDIDEVYEVVYFPLAHTLVGANLLLEEELAVINRLATEQTTGQRIKRARANYIDIADEVKVTPVQAVIVHADAKIEAFSRQRVLEGSLGARCGPLQSINKVHRSLESEVDRLKWLADARMEAILGSCCASLASVKSGIRCYLAFAEKLLLKVGKKLPPTVDELLA